MKRLVIGAAVTTLLVGVGVGSANAGATKGGAAQLACLVASSSSADTCTVSAGTAKLNLVTEGAGIYVYQATNAVALTPLSTLTQLGFSYTSGLTPRLNIPVNQSAYDVGRYDYVFIEGATCNDGLNHVTPLTNPVCAVQYRTDNGDGSYNYTFYDNWAAFTAANPSVATVNNDSNQPYVIQDTPGAGSVSNLQLGKPSLGGKRK